MADAKPNVLLVGPPKPLIVNGLSEAFAVHVLADAADPDAFLAEIGPRIAAIACTMVTVNVTRDIMAACPNLKIVSTFGVGYSHVDVRYAVAHGIVITNTPGVLTEEVADTTVGLLLATIHELPRADRYVRDGRWPSGDYPLTATLRGRTVGMVGMGAIGQAIARRLDAFGVPILYHSRNPVPGLHYRHYPRLIELARDVDTMIVIVPGGPATRHLVNADVLAALGENGVLVNMARGSVVDEQALIAALRDRTILTAGLDVFTDEPHVPAELLAMDHTVLLPHVGSATVATRDRMDRLVVDNLLAWRAGKAPLNPVAETPWPQAAPGNG